MPAALPRPFTALAWSNLAAQSAEQLSLAAVPLVAVLALNAGPGEIGITALVSWMDYFEVKPPPGLPEHDKVGTVGFNPAGFVIFDIGGARPEWKGQVELRYSAGPMELGLQWRYMFDNQRSIDIRAWRDLGRPNDALALVQSRDAGYGARVEMQLSGSRSPFVAERGFVGLQLDGGARITLRRSGGRPMIYYRNKF